MIPRTYFLDQLSCNLDEGVCRGSGPKKPPEPLIGPPISLHILADDQTPVLAFGRLLCAHKLVTSVYYPDEKRHYGVVWTERWPYEGWDNRGYHDYVTINHPDEFKIGDYAWLFSDVCPVVRHKQSESIIANVYLAPRQKATRCPTL